MLISVQQKAPAERCRGFSRFEVGLLFLGVVIDIDLDVLRPFFGQVFLGEDRLHRALIDAQAAVDAGVGVDVQLVTRAEVGFGLGGVNAVNRTDLDTRGVFGSNAGFADDVRHGRKDRTREAGFQPPTSAT